MSAPTASAPLAAHVTHRKMVRLSRNAATQLIMSGLLAWAGFELYLIAAPLDYKMDGVLLFLMAWLSLSFLAGAVQSYFRLARIPRCQAAAGEGAGRREPHLPADSEVAP